MGRFGSLLGRLPDFCRAYGIFRNLWDFPAERTRIYGPCLLEAGVGCSDSSGPSEPTETLIDFFEIDPRATYLHTCSNPADAFYDDGALDAVPILLADYGLAPGDEIRIEAIGDYYNGLNDRTKGIALFSSSATVLAASEPHRVPDAIEAGEDHVSGPTWGCGQEPMDIPEDFGYEPEDWAPVVDGELPAPLPDEPAKRWWDLRRFRRAKAPAGKQPTSRPATKPWWDWLGVTEKPGAETQPATAPAGP